MADRFMGVEYDTAHEAALVARAQTGDQSALGRLIAENQRWVFNVMLRMFPDYHEAEDQCQEALLKACAGIGGFKGASGFRTWLYRIAVNQALNAKSTNTERLHELHADKYADDDFMEEYLNQAVPDPKLVSHDTLVMAKELQIKCMLGMLLCLNRKQRMAFILGGILGLDGKMASSLMGIKEPDYRKTASRARIRLYNFVYDRCSLLNPGKPCTCERTIPVSIAVGYLDPGKLEYFSSDAPRVRDYVSGVRKHLDSIVLEKCQDLYRDHALQASPDFSSRVRAIMESGSFQTLLDANLA